ncbi:MAG: sugar nucleotide-binding protein [Burkholderiaceae bacterium]|nr:sugar nucleotide-binding protein [Burkholderiaceae bacterium]
MIAGRHTVLVVGADSQVGAALLAGLPSARYDVAGTSRRPHSADRYFYDLAQPEHQLPLHQFDTVVLCAAVSNMARCDNEPDVCRRLNVDHTCRLIGDAVAAGCYVVFLSSNTVFDGSQPFYAPHDPVAPLNNYGRFKLAVEQYIAALPAGPGAGAAAVLRLSKVITADAPFIVNWERAAAAGEAVRAFSNKLLSPIALEQVVAGIATMIDWRQDGLYHLAGDEELSYADFARRHFAADPVKLQLVDAVADPSAQRVLHNSLRTHMPNQCHACHQHALHPIAAPHTSSSVTSDCRPWPHPIALAVCGACGLVQKRNTPEYRQQCDEIYRSYAIYKQSDGAEQAVFTAQGTEFARSDRIIDWLERATPLAGGGDLLEIGCGNGSFLRKYSARQPGWQLLGTEFDRKNQPLIEAIPNAAFYCGDLSQLERKFDLIVAIHLLEHIFDPLQLLRQCAEHLNPGGRIFIQVPNVKESPFDLLIADHVSHFSIESLTALLNTAGFDILAVSDTNIAKELSLLVQPRPATPAIDVAPWSALLGDYLAFFAELKNAPLPDGAPVGIFGSSISATWLASELAGRISFFVDEDSNRIGKQHMDLPIVGLDGIPAGATVLLPMNPKIAKAIAARLAPRQIQFVLPADTE